MNETRRENNAAVYGSELTSENIRRRVTDSARRAEETVRAHPYFTTGIVAGLGIAVVGAMFLGMRRRRTIWDRLASYF